jgi:hypothetical protein
VIPDEAVDAARMRYSVEVNVLPEYVQAYLDDGWVMAEDREATK